ncbi:MAG: hypothetical protein WCO43_04115 [Chitinophagia bacterium]
MKPTHLNRVAGCFCFMLLVYFTWASTPVKADIPTVNLFSGKTNIVEVTGYGKTEEEARMNAEIKAIVSTIGSFVTQQTEIVNDQLVSDKIAEISAGTITKVEILKPFNGNSITIRAHVSVKEVMKFCKNNGIGTEIEGSAIASEFNRQERNESGERTALSGLSGKIQAILNRAFDYKIIADEPKLNPYSKYNADREWVATDEFILPLTVEVYSNDNFKILYQEIMTTLKGITMTPSEAATYKKMGKEVFEFSVFSENDIKKYYSSWHTGNNMFPERTNKNTVYLRTNPRNVFYNLFGESEVTQMNKQFVVRMTGSNDQIGASSFKPIETLSNRYKKYDVNNYAPYMYMSELRRTPLDRIKFYPYDQVLIIPSQGEILTGVMALDYKVPISRLKQYKKIEVFPLNR